ncbi:hypothetical protein AQUSIP_02600 [Aquicella siphonis]|uniref:Uncharacterized protein n=1 Tax=Aquicella siphonis TaxID=254247 RepID=A0A5E4PF79_9COXI|nr:hypothetical protein [Aquicella siphonis]VVC74986.1 hypothetical protein AQUSIP_02600 [Aquicella siphonis]
MFNRKKTSTMCQPPEFKFSKYAGALFTKYPEQVVVEYALDKLKEKQHQDQKNGGMCNIPEIKLPSPFPGSF